MRRNLRLDWRALALLGALLSIIIDWPGLVYAMPTILPPVAATAAEASPIDTLNTIKNDKTVSFLNDQPDSNKRFATMTPSLKQDIEMKLTQQQQQHQQHQPSPLQQIVQRITTTNEKLKQQQVNDNQNSIRKQQQLNYKKQEEEKTKHEEKFEIATAIHNKAEEGEEEEEEENENSSAIPLAAAKNQKLESLPKVTSLLKNTHKKNSTNTNTENNTFKSTTTTTATVTAVTAATGTSGTSILSIATTTTPPTTTESLVRIPSTLMPTIIVEAEAQAPPQQTQYHQHKQQQEQFETSFKFSSSHHLAILNLHQKNNLDRNERSTVSHLSGPSRKIQLYIKNRFIQLLPDGTVNGTQDEQCDYKDAIL
ncbi:hypothetical protein DOY81_005494 [Sarcophaga bullata]|nr:hypothetical protein DOY81_005494 [Sarcophaga bullata]